MSPYGRACLQCTKAKVRCAYGTNEQAPCERCTRLRKVCQPAPRARVSKSKPRVDKHSALEAKVDGLVEILRRNQAIPSDDGRSHSSDGPTQKPQRCGPALAATPLYQLSLQAGNQERLPAPTSKSQSMSMPSLTSQSPGRACAPRNGVPVQGTFVALMHEARNDLKESSNISPATDSTAGSANTTMYSTPASSIGEIPPETHQELQDILNAYRDTMCQFSPIVLIGPEVTVEQMASERPYLWLVIRMICTKKLARQLAFGEEINRMIATKLIIEGERSFDMLCALIVHVNWGQFSCVKANLSPPIHLAFALAGDLGLTKPAPQTSPAIMMNWTQAGCPKPPHALAIKKRTMEERRVVLGLFYVSSICANFFQRSEPMRWTPYLEESLALLSETKEHPSDEYLALLIRIQIIANGLTADGWNEAYPMAAGGHRPPRAHYTHLHKMQLDDLKRTIPPHLKENPILRYHIDGAEVSLYEQFLQPSAIASGIDQTKHVEGLWSCFATIKAYFDRFFDSNTNPLASYLYINISVYTHLGHCLVALFRLSTFEAPGIPWDRQYIISQIDLGTVVRKWIDIFESSPKAAGIDISGACGQDSQWEYSKRILLTTILKWWETKVRPSIMGGADEQEQRDVSAGHTAEHEAQGPAPDGFDASMDFGDMGDMNFDFNTEPWMRDLFGNGFDFRGF